ncbi:unnamed protein product, partial [Heterosigma akashiwo]
MFETYDEEHFKPSSSRAAGGGQAMPKFGSPRLDSGTKYGSKQATPRRQLRNDRAVSENDWEPRHIRPLPEHHRPGGLGYETRPVRARSDYALDENELDFVAPVRSPHRKDPGGMPIAARGSVAHMVAELKSTMREAPERRGPA